MAKKKKIKTLKKKIKSPQEIFGEWWSEVAEKQVAKIEKKWIKENEPNDPDDDGGGDHWHVNQMMHEGDAHNATYDIAEQVFIKGYNEEEWKMSMGDSLFCDLDDVIFMAYEAGKKAKE